MKHKKMHRILSMLLAVSLAFSMTSGFAFAADEGANGAGSAIGTSSVGGENVTDSGTPPAPPQVLISDIVALINDLRDLDLTNKDAVLEKQDSIQALKDAYAALSTADRVAFNEGAEKTRYDELIEALAGFLRENRPGLTSDDVGAMLDALAGVKLSDRVELLAAKDKLTAALKAYEKLAEGEKRLLTEAQAAFVQKLSDALKAYYEKPATSAEIAELISRLATAADAGEAPDADAVRAARAAYDALTEEEKTTFDADTLALLVMLEAALAVVPMAELGTKITNQAGLTAMTDSGNYYLANDITLSGAWTPLFSNYSDFSGTLDGNGHKITGLSVNTSDGEYAGLIGQLSHSGTVKNLHVEGEVRGSVNNAGRYGGIVGLNEGTITNCSFSGKVWNTAGDNHAIGGICGRNDGSISNCTNKGDVSGKSYGGSYNAVYVGGIAGSNHGTITASTNYGVMTGEVPGTSTYYGNLFGSDSWKDNGGYVGGIAGDTGSSGVVNCTNGGPVIADNGKPVDITTVPSAAPPVALDPGNPAPSKEDLKNQLPEKVKIETSGGSRLVDVIWDVEGSAYDPAKAGDYSINGTLTLPVDGKITNNDSTELTTSVIVTVTTPAEPGPTTAITITVNGGAAVGGTSLSDAVTKSGTTAANITALKITAGEVTADDWNYFAGGTLGTTKSPFTALTTFEVDAAVTTVADIPNGDSQAPIFPTTITSVIIPQAITVGNNAFEMCTKLTTVSLPEAKSIGEEAFSGCRALVTVSLAEATSIGSYAFSGCTKLGTVSLPEATSIGEKAFYDCRALVTVSLPAATSIGVKAFSGCTALTSVSLPAATSIGEKAFNGCTALATVSLPAATSIVFQAFNGCTALATLKLGATVPTVDAYLLFGSAPQTNPLVIVDVDGNELTDPAVLAAAIAAYKAAPDGNITDGKWCGWTLPAAPELPKITIKMDKDTNEYTGNNLKEAMESCHNVPFEPNADYDPGRTTALNIIAGEVTESDWYTMKAWRRDLRSLETFQIAEGVKVANLPDTESDFSIFPKSIQTVKIPQITAVGKNVFRYCSALTSVSLPNVTTVGDFAFASCSDLTTVNLSTATTSIGANAFLGCRSLAELKLGATPPTFVGDSAFQDCPRPRTLKLVKPDGTPLTGEALTTAQKNYDKVAEHIGTSTATDGLWYGWTIGGGTTAGHVCNGITFDKALPTSGQSLPAGNYYLDGDVNASANFFMPEGTVVNLCLNGHTLTTSNPNDGGTGSKFASMSLNRASTNLNIYDCSADNSGKITGGNGGDGGCIHNSYGILNLYGGTITGNTASKGGGVYNYSENLTLYGKASITGNTNRAGGASNLYYDRYYPIKVGGKLSGTIGITPSQLPDEYSEARIAIAASGYTLTADDLKCFVSDVAGYEVVQTTYDGKACFSLKKVVAKPAPGGKLEAPLTQDKVDGVFGEGNATLDNTATPPKITIDNSIIPEKPIEIETDVTIDLGGNTITGKPGQPGLVVGDGDKVTVSGGGTISGGDNPGGAGGNGITGGAGSDITIGGGVTVEGGDGGAGGDGINSGGNVSVDGSVSGGSGSSGAGGDGVDTSTGSGDITVGGDGTVSGGNSTGGNGNGGDGTSSGGNTIIGGDVTGGTGNGSGSGGNGATDTAGGSGNISVQPGGSAQGGNGGASGGAGGNGVENNGGGSTTVGGSTSGGNGGNSSSGTGGAGGNGSISTGGGSIEVGGGSTGGNGGSGSTGGIGGNGTSTGGSTTVTGGGTATGGAGGSGSTSGGNGGDGASSGSTTINKDGEATGGSGGSGATGSNGNGGNGGNGVHQGTGTVGDNGTATGGNGGSGAGTGSGGNGGAGVGGGAKPGDNLIVKNGISAKVEVVGDAKTEVKLPDPAKTVNAILTPEEKADPTITDVKVTLKVDDKTADKPTDANQAENAKPVNSVIGAFFDITLQKTITKNGAEQSPETVTNVPNGVVTITIEIPTGMRDGVEGSYVVIRVHNGTGETLATMQSGNDLTFETDQFSTYAIAYTKNATPPTPPSDNTSGGGGGSSSDNDQYDFWMTVKEKIQNADSGDVIKVNAKGYDKMPSSVMGALRKNSGVSLVITWSGKTITIPAGKAQKNESGRIYWPLSKLVELYSDIAEDAVLKPAEQTNPTTGGPGKYIPVTGGGELIILEAPSPTIENTLPNGTENTQTIAPTQPKAITPPDAGFEQDAFAGTPDAKQGTDSNAFAVIALMLAAAAVGSGVWFWKKRHENEQSSGT